jgi:hypothetical protein
LGWKQCSGEADLANAIMVHPRDTGSNHGVDRIFSLVFLLKSQIQIYPPQNIKE